MHVAKNHENISDGGVSLPYLNKWDKSSGSLLDLSDVCITAFYIFPPVRSNPKLATFPTPIQQYEQINNTIGSSTMTSPQPDYAVPFNKYQYQPSDQSSSLPYVNFPIMNQTHSGQGNGYVYPATSVSTTTTTTAGTIGYSTPYQVRNRQEMITSIRLKIQGELQVYFNKIREEVDSEFIIQKELNKNKTTINLAKEEIERQIKQMNEYLVRIKEEISIVKNFIETASNKEKDKSVSEEEVDELIVPGDKLSIQMYDSVCGSKAIDDLYYYLDKAIVEGNVGLDDFLKVLRKKAREQFMMKALTKRILETQQKIHLQS